MKKVLFLLLLVCAIQIKPLSLYAQLQSHRPKTYPNGKPVSKRAAALEKKREDSLISVFKKKYPFYPLCDKSIRIDSGGNVPVPYKVRATSQMGLDSFFSYKGMFYRLKDTGFIRLYEQSLKHPNMLPPQDTGGEYLQDEMDGSRMTKVTKTKGMVMVGPTIGFSTDTLNQYHGLDTSQKIVYPTVRSILDSTKVKKDKKAHRKIVTQTSLDGAKCNVMEIVTP